MIKYDAIRSNSDQTSDYVVNTDAATVRDFVDGVLREFPGRWGFFNVMVVGDGGPKAFRADYYKGELTTVQDGFRERLSARCPEKISANGGPDCMTYAIILDDVYTCTGGAAPEPRTIRAEVLRLLDDKTLAGTIDVSWNEDSGRRHARLLFAHGTIYFADPEWIRHRDKHVPMLEVIKHRAGDAVLVEIRI